MAPSFFHNLFKRLFNRESALTIECSNSDNVTFESLEFFKVRGNIKLQNKDVLTNDMLEEEQKSVLRIKIP